ncbi:hypothetical protein [Rufibacter quisquiliarum]|uniref:Uncharacterized protein n=1 Tax=Rufibacter quisquiliarum TaxID=1549639 RepID=A0A839GTA0_9BACT|nr:hypothetical protein [Rufibacter quisquiliarum]MBA9077638.1 hypothetical protein [Rufibacter quisquiliarum]
MNYHFPRLLFLIVAGIFFCKTDSFSQKIKSASFTYAPETAGNYYNQQIPRKSYPVNATDFVILSRKSNQTYAVERYGADLKTRWSAPFSLLGSESLVAFAVSAKTALVVTHRIDPEQGSQALYGTILDLTTGKELQQKKLQEAPSKSRRLTLSVSEDGSKLVTYHSITRDEQLRSMLAVVYDATTLNKIKERPYDFGGTNGQVTAQVHIDNRGDQYVSLLTDNNMRLSVRRYNNQDNEIKVMEVMVGGVFDGEKRYVLDAHYQLAQDSSLYAAVLVAEEKSGDYRSLKLVKFDYAINNMRFAEEFVFTPEFSQRVAKASGANRLEDIYLSDILVSTEGQALVLAEKKYEEGGENSPYHAKELLLFSYDEYLNPTWNSVILKNQVAPATEGFAGISYSARLFGNRLQLLTLETLNGKTDLYNRSIHLLTGTSDTPKPMGLNVANDMGAAYVKDFTTWLEENSIIAVNRPSKASAGLRLSRITFK